MKKTLLLAALSAGMLTANAQVTDAGAKFTDNWSVGINAGGVTTMHVHYAFWKHMRPVVGLQINKDFTPTLGMTLEGNASINTSNSPTAFDATNVSLLGRVNLMNLFAGYKGQPRLFEMEAVGGFGWLHYYGHGWDYYPANYDTDAWTMKLGLNFDFNVGEKKAWTIQLKPAVIYNLSGIGYESNRGVMNPGSLSRNSAMFELTAGVVYHFKNSNGTHSFANIRPYDQAEVDALNSQINALRSEVGQKNDELNRLQGENRQLQRDLNDCRNKKVEASKAVGAEAVVSFQQGKSTVMSTQMASIERIATYMKNNPDTKVVITGYASPEGSKSWNKRLSQKRADAVKKILVKKYDIDASRITAEGKGVGSIFSNPSWNRVSICTVE